MTEGSFGGTVRWRRVVAIAASVVAVMVGLVMILLAVTLGSCDAFGGRCPAERPAIFDDDVFGMAALGAFLLVGAPSFLARPTVLRLPVATGVGLVAAVIVGLVARAVAHG